MNTSKKSHDNYCILNKIIGTLNDVGGGKQAKIRLEREAGNLAKIIQNGMLWKLTVLSHRRVRLYLMKLKEVYVEEAEGHFGNYLLFYETFLGSIFSPFSGHPHPIFFQRPCYVSES